MLLVVFRWSKHFSDAIESFNRREGKSKLKEPFNDDDSDSERVHDLPPANEVAPERAEAVGGEEHTPQRGSTATVSTSSSSSPKENRTSVIDGDNSAAKEDQEKQQEVEQEDKSDVNSEENRDSTTDSPGKFEEWKKHFSLISRGDLMDFNLANNFNIVGLSRLVYM